MELRLTWNRCSASTYRIIVDKMIALQSLPSTSVLVTQTERLCQVTLWLQLLSDRGVEL